MILQYFTVENILFLVSCVKLEYEAIISNGNMNLAHNSNKKTIYKYIQSISSIYQDGKDKESFL